MSNSPRDLATYEPYLRLIARNYTSIVGLTGVDHNDLVQETLTRAHEHRHQFRGQAEAEFTGWLRKILRNHLQDLLRRYENRGAFDLQLNRLDDSFIRLEEMVIADDSTPSRRASRKEHVAALSVAMQLLPEDQRLAVELRHLRGMPLKEIANQLERSPAAVGALIYRALTNLRRTLAQLE